MLSTDTTTETTTYIPDYTQNQRWLRAVARQGYIVATITMEGHWNDSGEYRMHTRVSNEKPRATRLGSRQLVVAEQILAELMVKVLAALTAAGWYEHIGSYRHFTEWEAPWSTNTADRLNERVSSHCAGCGRSLWSEGKNWGRGYWLTSCPACPQAAEVAEQAIEVYARPAEPEPTPVYVAEPAEQPAPAPEQPAQPPCFCPDCGRSLFDSSRQIWLTLCPNCWWSAPEPVPAWLNDADLPPWLQNVVNDADALLAEAEQIRSRREYSVRVQLAGPRGYSFFDMNSEEQYTDETVDWLQKLLQRLECDIRLLSIAFEHNGEFYAISASEV